MPRPTVDDVVRLRVDVQQITSVKQVIMLKGFRDDGKTTALKEVIKRLHQRFPNAWRSRKRYNPEKFELSGVSTVVGLFIYSTSPVLDGALISIVSPLV